MAENQKTELVRDLSERLGGGHDFKAHIAGLAARRDGDTLRIVSDTPVSVEDQISIRESLAQFGTVKEMRTPFNLWVVTLNPGDEVSK